MPGLLQLISIIQAKKQARKLVAAKLDNRDVELIEGKTSIHAGKLVVEARYRVAGQEHAVAARRTLLGEDATVTIDGAAVDQPDVDLKSGLRGLKVAVKYIVQYEQAGVAHELRFYAFVRVLGL